MAQRSNNAPSPAIDGKLNMGDSTYCKHPIQLSDSTINPRPKRRKYGSGQKETLVQLLNQLEKNSSRRSYSRQLGLGGSIQRSEG